MAWLSATMRRFLSENPDKVKEAEKYTGPREPTPAYPLNDKFVGKIYCNKNYNERQSDGRVFVEKLTHDNSDPKKCLPHYEVYKQSRYIERGRPERSVTWDGKPMT
jgi:hypothetical protein